MATRQRSFASTTTRFSPALTAAAAAGEMISVKTFGAAATTATVVATNSLVTMAIPVALLAAGADLADFPLYAVPTGYTFTLISADILGEGDSADIDDDNTSVFAIKETAATVATKTYDTAPGFPAAGVVDSLGAITNATALVAGKVLKLNITNGTTAATPALKVLLVGTLTAAA